MRYWALDELLQRVFGDAEGEKSRKALERAMLKLERADASARGSYVKSNGGRKWAPVKDKLAELTGNKCWYTEVEALGAPLTVDHFRPKAAYWWLSFEPMNFRVACHFTNSLSQNSDRISQRGKGESFPLFDPNLRATSNDTLDKEEPILLDPCSRADCELLAFQADGRPVLSPHHLGNEVAHRRVEESKPLLNLDHPAFNAKREELYFEICRDVKHYETCPSWREDVSQRLSRRIAHDAPFSTAARNYLRLFRHLEWVEDLLKKQD